MAKPLGDRILIELKAEEKTASGIILTESAQSLDGKIGTVVAVGNGVYTNNGAKIPMEIKVGDKVRIKSSGRVGVVTEVNDDGTYTISELPDSDTTAIDGSNYQSMQKVFTEFDDGGDIIDDNINEETEIGKFNEDEIEVIPPDETGGGQGQGQGHDHVPRT